MYVGFKNHKTESLGKLFSSISKGLFICILLAGCAERPPSAINPENTPPSVTIISPAKADILQVPAHSPKTKEDKKLSEADINLAERKGIDLKSKHLTNVKKKTIEKEVVSKKADRKTNSKSSGIYKKGTGLVFQGLAVDVEGDSISESSLRWTSDKEGEIGKGYSFTKSDLSAGEHQIVLTATDSEGGVGRDTVNITIEDQSGIIVKILSLEEGWSLLNTTELILRGVAEDPEDGELEGESLVWKSSKDGVLGTGSPLDRTGKLSLGDHTITLMGTDSDRNTGQISVDISITDKIDDTINNSPIANILNVDDILTLLGSDILSLEGSVSDPDEDIVKIVWSSDKDGELGRGTTLEIPAGDLTLGEHTITFTATDDDGATDSDSMDLTVHKPPVTDILSLKEGMSLLESADLILEGAAEDFEDGTLRGESLVWISSMDDTLGTGSKLDVTGKLSIGDHTITLTATDSEGATGSDEVTISVNLAPPTNVTAKAINSTTVQLSWQDNSNHETHFVIEQNSEVKLKSDKNITSFEVTDLLESTSYEFRVAAENSKGASGFSKPVTVETLPIQINSIVTADNTLDSNPGDEVIPDGVISVGVVQLEESTYAAALQFGDIDKDISGRIINKAVLQLYPALSLETLRYFELYAFATPWDPASITWNNQPQKIDMKPIEKNVVLTAGEPIEFDITTVVQNWASNEWENNGLFIELNQSLTEILSKADFESLETGRDKLAPRIIVDFEN